MRKIRIAQIGVNRYSHSHEIFTTLAIHPELFEVAGYALVEDERETCASKLHHFDGYPELSVDEILNDPTIEAVTIETDEIHITKYAIMAAEHGKHIHMEKPGSQCLEDFERLIELVRKNGKVFHVGYMYRYNPYISNAIERARRGELGEIFGVETHMSRTDGKDVRRWLSSFKGGMMFYLGCHLIDLVLQVQGVPMNVMALNRSTHLDGIDTEDNSLALLEYPTGFSIVRVSAAEIGGFARRQFVIMGSKGTIDISPLEILVPEKENGGIKWSQKTGKAERFLNSDDKWESKEYESEAFGRYESMIGAFAAMVRGEKTNPYSLDYELMLYKTVLKCCGMNVKE